MRKLLYGPLLHDPVEDMKGEPLDAGRMLGMPIEEIKRTSDAYTLELWEKAKAHKIDKLYVDSVDLEGEEAVKFLKFADTQMNSLTNKMILDLIGRGAVVVAAESKELLDKLISSVRKELRLVMETFGSGDTPGPESIAEIKRMHEANRGIVAERDRYIARKIGETLYDGEVGALFIGAEHETAKYLDSSIVVEYLLGIEYANELYDSIGRSKKPI